MYEMCIVKETRELLGEEEFKSKFELFFEKVKSDLCEVGEYGWVLYEGERPVLFGSWKLRGQIRNNCKEFCMFSFEKRKVENKLEKKARKIKESQEKSYKEKVESSIKYKNKAKKLEDNMEKVVLIMEIIKNSFSSNLSEDEFERFRQESAEKGNLYAQMIRKINFADKKVILKVEESEIENSFLS